MRENQTLIEDVMTLGGNLLGNLLGARHEMKAQGKQRMEGLARQLDLVSRSEFDAAFAMLAKARAMQDDLHERLAAIESRLGLASPVKGKNAKMAAKVNLPFVKKDKHKAKRK